MRGKKHLIFALSVGVFLGAVTASAFGADVISYSNTLDFTHANFTQSLSVPQFDPALGTLDSVTLQFALGQESTVKAELLDPLSPGSYEYDLGWSVTMTGLGGQTLLQLVDGAVSSGDLSTYDGAHDYAGTSGFTDFYAGDDSDTRSFSNSTPGFDSFIGTGSMSFIVQALANLTMSGSGAPLDVVHETNVTAHVDVTYEYLPIPEPVSLAFFGAGFLIAFLRRHRF